MERCPKQHHEWGPPRLVYHLKVCTCDCYACFLLTDEAAKLVLEVPKKPEVK